MEAASFAQLKAAVLMAQSGHSLERRVQARKNYIAISMASEFVVLF
jgi:hypothetical protein